MMENIEYLRRTIDFNTLSDVPPRLFHQGLLNDLNMPSAENSTYTSCYCEENVWKLCEYVRNHSPDKMDQCYAVFISNEQESVALWSQKSGRPPDGLTIWDYHVIFVYHAKLGKGSLIYDLDSALPCYPMHIEIYAPYTFRLDKILEPRLHRYFRVVPSETYLKTFSSDRSRMKMEDGTWRSLPPNYPCISTFESSNNLEDFISMDPHRGIGEVMNLDQFINKFFSDIS